MYLLNPESVIFGATVLGDVQSLVVDRTAKRTVMEWTDVGPYAAFVDVPEQRVSVRIVRRLVGEQVTSIKPGDERALRVTVSTAGARSDAGRHTLVMTCVVTSVTHELAGSGAGGKGAMQTIVMEAVSESGAESPIGTE